MKEVLAVFQDKSLDKFGGLWTIFEKLGTELGNIIGNGIDTLFEAIEKNNIKKHEK